MSEAAAVIHLPDRSQPAPKATTRHGSEKRKRSAGILVKLTPADHQRVKEDAAAAGMSAAGYLASGRLDREAAPRPRIRQHRARADVAAMLKALVAFHRANNNLNQTAHTGNMMMLFAADHGAEKLAEIGRELVQAVRAQQNEFAPVLAAIQAALDDCER
jgi:hypothetical protein